jgi:indolepyruvate ferredoxin oxidoreductase alpha subunit
MKLSTLWPLPEQTLCSFIRSVEQVLILEENEPFIETHVKRIAYDAGLRVPISGKYDDAVSREGELFRWQIAESLMSFIPGFSPTRSFSPESEKKDMPSLTGIPENCPYTPVFETLLTLGEALNIRPVYVVDPGCAVKINTPPFEMLDIKYSMGSSIGIASGLVLAGISDPVIAVVGDSDFFHLAINALFNVAYQGSDLLVIVLDNDTTALSGFQPVPNRDARVFGRRVTRLNIEDLAAACPVSMVETVDPWNPEGMREVLRKGLTKSGVRVIISRSPCPYIDKKFCPGYKAAGQTHEAPV